jgi:hypothetical protein
MCNAARQILAAERAVCAEQSEEKGMRCDIFHFFVSIAFVLNR